MNETPQNPSNIDPLDLAAQVYAGLAERDIDEIERIALDRRDNFSSKSQRLDNGRGRGWECTEEFDLDRP